MDLKRNNNEILRQLNKAKRKQESEKVYPAGITSGSNNIGVQKYKQILDRTNGKCDINPPFGYGGNLAEGLSSSKTKTVLKDSNQIAISKRNRNSSNTQISKLSFRNSKHNIRTFIMLAISETQFRYLGVWNSKHNIRTFIDPNLAIQPIDFPYKYNNLRSRSKRMIQQAHTLDLTHENNSRKYDGTALLLDK